MEVKAITKYVRIAPEKVRDLTREIQGKSVAEALNITEFSERKAALHVGKTLKSAIANAEHNNGMSVENLMVKMAVVEEGPTIRRGWYGARGMFKPIGRRMSHIRIVVSDE